MKTAKEIIQLLNKVRGQLVAAQHASPSDKYQHWKVVEDLIDSRTRTANQVLRSPKIRKHISQFRNLYGQFLYELELQWSKKLLDHLAGPLTEYPKYRHYELRVSYEMHMLQVVRPRPFYRILLIGCGPLPLSALMIKHKFGVEVDLLDRSAEALSHARRLIRRHGKGMKNKFLHTDALRFAGFDKYEVVFLAGTVGSDSITRQKIIERIFSRMKEGSVLVLRPPINLEKLLLADVDPTAVPNAEVFWSEFDCKEDTMRRAFLVRKNPKTDQKMPQMNQMTEIGRGIDGKVQE